MWNYRYYQLQLSMAHSTIILSWLSNNQRICYGTISESSLPSSFRGRRGKLPKLLQCRSFILHRVKASLRHDDIDIILVATRSVWRYESPIVISTLNTDVNFNTASESIYGRVDMQMQQASYFWTDYDPNTSKILYAFLSKARHMARLNLRNAFARLN